MQYVAQNSGNKVTLTIPYQEQNILANCELTVGDKKKMIDNPKGVIEWPESEFDTELLKKLSEYTNQGAIRKIMQSASFQCKNSSLGVMQKFLIYVVIK